MDENFQLNLNDIFVDLKIESSSEEATQEAENISRLLTEFYYDSTNISPALITQIKLETETLSLLYQLRKWDESASKELMNGIQMSPTNASLYRALSDMQRTIIAITEKIDDTKLSLINLLKNSQSEKLDEEEDSSDETSKSIFRGNKEYIKMMQKKLISNIHSKD